MSIIRAGKVVETGTISALRHRTRTAVHAEVTTPPTDLASLPGMHDVVVEGLRVSASVDTAVALRRRDLAN